MRCWRAGDYNNKGVDLLMKVYGAQICIDCRNYKAIQKNRGFEADYIEITEDTGKLKEFLQIRDHDPVLASVRESGGIGIPLFVNEDGRKTLDIDEAFSWIGQPPVKEEGDPGKKEYCSNNHRIMCLSGRQSMAHRDPAGRREILAFMGLAVNTDF